MLYNVLKRHLILWLVESFFVSSFYQYHEKMFLFF